MKSLLVKLLKRFYYAFTGMLTGIRNDSSIAMQCVIALLVLSISLFFPLTKSEWMIVILLCTLVCAMEWINSALEELVDLVSPGYHEKAKRCKDYGAAAVLVISIGAAGIAAMIYIPYLIQMIGG